MERSGAVQPKGKSPIFHESESKTVENATKGDETTTSATEAAEEAKAATETTTQSVETWPKMGCSAHSCNWIKIWGSRGEAWDI